MNEYKIGGKIVLSEDEQYYILEILKYEGKDYLFCTTAIGKIKPVILEMREKDGKTQVREEKDPRIISEISAKIIIREDEEMLKKILKEN